MESSMLYCEDRFFLDVAEGDVKCYTISVRLCCKGLYSVFSDGWHDGAKAGRRLRDMSVRALPAGMRFLQSRSCLCRRGENFMSRRYKNCRL